MGRCVEIREFIKKEMAREQIVGTHYLERAYKLWRVSEDWRRKKCGHETLIISIITLRKTNISEKCG
jgi:hypothetical protein